MINSIIARYYVELVLGGISAIFVFVYKKFTQHKRDHEAIKLGMQAMLGNEISKLGEIYISQGYISLKQQDRVDFSYAAYKAVNGNHGIDKVKQEIDDLPIR